MEKFRRPKLGVEIDKGLLQAGLVNRRGKEKEDTSIRI